MKKIGKYEVCGLLGKGGMGTVYKVRIAKIGKIVALKLLEPHPHLVDSLGMEEIKNRFKSEAITMASLRHPNIVSVWDFDEADGKPFLVMEYFCNNLGLIIGESYRLEKPSRILLLDKTIHYLRQILAGLSRLHQASIIHRDIKPYNILVTDDDIAKITDFAFSKLRGEVLKVPPNLMVGSPYYAAPEQEQDPDKVDATADLYSLGVMAYRMLTGMLPGEDGKRPSECNPDLTGDWDRFVAKATAKNRKDRYTSCAEMVKILEDLAADWQERKKAVCEVVVPDGRAKKARPASKKPLRDQSIKVRPRQAREVLQLDELWRPRQYVINDFRVSGDGTVADSTTGLVWQQDGSDFQMTWHEAHAYVKEINSKGFAGRNNWRLPTVDELCSLLTETPHGADLCIEPLFSQEKKWLWSADRSSYIAAWYVSLDLGFIGWQDFSCCYFVRAVCSHFFGNFAEVIAVDH